MYAAPIAALIGELFGKSLRSILVTALLPAVAWLACRNYLNAISHGPSGATPLGFVILLGCAVQLACLFAYVDMTSGAKGSGFPKHILLLPAPTWLLALVPIVAGSAFISAFVLLWLHFVTATELAVREQLIICAAIAALMCWLQAMSWELLPSRFLRIVVLTVAAIAAVLSVVSLVAADAYNLFGRTKGAVGLSVTSLGGFSLAYLAVIRSRCGETFSLGAQINRVLSSSGLQRRSAALPALTNAVTAQNWYEWRSYGRLLPTCMLILTIGPVAAHAFARVRHAPSFVLPGLVLFLFFLVAPMVGGAYVSKNLSRRVGMGLFDATRPLTDLQLAWAKLRLAVRSYALGLAVVIAAVLACLLTSDNHAVLLGDWSRLTAALGAVGACVSVLLVLMLSTSASWAASTYFMALQLLTLVVDRRKHGWKISLAVLALFLLLLNQAGRLYSRRSATLAWLDSPRYELVIPVLVLVGIGLWLVLLFRRWNGLGALRGLGTGFGVVTGLTLAAVWPLDLSAGYHWALSCLVLTVALLTFIPYLLMPVLVSLNRHT